MAVTVLDVEALEIQFVPEIAFAVITWPGKKVMPEIVHAVPTAIVFPISISSAKRITLAPETEVPVTEVVVVKMRLVEMTGAVVCVVVPTHTYTPFDSHLPETV